MFALTYAAGILATVCAICGILFLFKRHSPLHSALAGYALTASLWIGGNTVADVTYAESALFIAAGIGFVGGAANTFCFLVLIDALIHGELPGRVRLAVYAIPSLVFSALAFSRYAITGSSFTFSSPAQITPGPLCALLLLFHLCAFYYGAVRLFSAARAAKVPTHKLQLSYCFAGLLITLAGEIFFYVLLPLMGVVRFYTIGPMTSLAFIAGCSYAIFRHRLIDLRLVVRRLEEKVEARTRELRLLQEEQRRMIADLTHNLQTPLSILKTKLERMEGTHVRDGNFANLERSVDQLSSFVADLLALATLDDTLRMESREVFSLSVLLEEIAEEVSVITEPRAIRFHSAIAPGLTCLGNKKRVREAVMNVASNAVKYIGEGPERRIVLALVRRGDDAAITVTDTGIGIPEKELEAVRARFYRGSAHGYGSQPGTGLGLAFAERIVRGMGGSLAIHSVPGAGSTFTFTLPLDRKGGS